MARKIVVKNKLQLRKISKQVRAATNTMLSEIARHLEGEAANVLATHQHAHGKGHNYKGQLHDDLRCERFEDKKSAGVACYLGGESEVYGEVIHNQRDIPAKAPPFAPLSEWVAYKLGIPKDAPEHFIIVKTIQRNIARRGLKTIPREGLQFFWNPLQENYKTYLKWISKAVQRVSRTQLGKF